MPGVTTAYQNGVHGSRPAASAGCILYACSTHSLIYRSDGSSWTTWMTIGSTTTTVASDVIWDAKGDSAWATGADAATKLTAGSNGMVPVYDSAQSNGVKTAYPPDYEFDYVAITSDVSITATTEATANTAATANAVTFDGSTTIYVEFNAYAIDFGTSFLAVVLYDNIGGAGAASIGRIGLGLGATGNRVPLAVRSSKLTPSNASHVFSIRAYVDGGTGTVEAGAGGSGNKTPGYIRVVKA